MISIVRDQSAYGDPQVREFSGVGAWSDGHWMVGFWMLDAGCVKRETSRQRGAGVSPSDLECGPSINREKS